MTDVFIAERVSNRTGWRLTNLDNPPCSQWALFLDEVFMGVGTLINEAKLSAWQPPGTPLIVFPLLKMRAVMLKADSPTGIPDAERCSPCYLGERPCGFHWVSA